MVKDENWWDAVGKDLWREKQFEKEIRMAESAAASDQFMEPTCGIYTTPSVPQVRK